MIVLILCFSGIVALLFTCFARECWGQAGEHWPTDCRNGRLASVIVVGASVCLAALAIFWALRLVMAVIE